MEPGPGKEQRYLQVADSEGKATDLERTSCGNGQRGLRVRRLSKTVKRCRNGSAGFRRKEEPVKKVTKKLILKKETLGLLLNPAELKAVVGGATEGCASCPHGDLSTCPGPATLDGC